MANQGLKRSFLRIGTSVDFIKDTALERHANPVLVPPHEATRIHQLRRRVHALRVKSRSEIRKLSRSVQAIEIALLRLKRFDYRNVITVMCALHFVEPFLCSNNVNS